MIHAELVAYILLCVLGPLVWGVGIYLFGQWLGASLKRNRPDDGQQRDDASVEPDYYI
jgi:hypothetical protein